MLSGRSKPVSLRGVAGDEVGAVVAPPLPLELAAAGDRAVAEPLARRGALCVPVRVAVVVDERAFAGPRLGLLTGQPGTPRRDAAGAIVHCPSQTHVLPEPAAVGPDGARRRAAACAWVVGEPVEGGNTERLVAADLVVRHDRRAEDTVRVGIARYRRAIVEQRLSGPRDHAVGEAGREGEDAVRVVQ